MNFSIYIPFTLPVSGQKELPTKKKKRKKKNQKETQTKSTTKKLYL